MCVCVFVLIFFMKAYAVGTHLTCIDKSMQFKRAPTTYLYNVADNKYTGCNLQTMELLGCALFVCVWGWGGVCAVMRSNTVLGGRIMSPRTLT